MPRRRSRARHNEALKLPYEVYLWINGGVELCAICGRAGKTRRLHRDHDHRTGVPRGLLCVRCNRILHTFVDVEWLMRARAYLERAEVLGPQAREKYEAGEIESTP